jgi:glycosyltransferase involved in cell wall biosynthesis
MSRADSLEIVVVTPTLIPDGGVAVHVARSVAALRASGCRVTVVSAAAPGDSNAVVLPELVSGEIGAAALERLRHEVAACGAQVVHLHGLGEARVVRTLRDAAATVVSAHGWAGCAPGTRYFGAGRECGRRHGPGCVPNMLFSNCKHAWDPRTTLSSYRKTRDRLDALRAADATLAYSRAVASHLRDNRVPNVRVIPLSVAAPAAPPPYPSSAPRVAFVGRLSAAKGVSVLLASAGRFEAHIDVIGDGWQRPALERAARRLGLGDRVTFHGWRGADDVRAAYTAAHVAVMPSLWPEPFGMVGLEAMAQARPVIASSTGGIGDWLEHERTGLMVSPGRPEELGAAIATLLSNPNDAREMGVNGHRSVRERYTDDGHVAALLAVYGDAIRARERGRTARSAAATPPVFGVMVEHRDRA